MNQSIFKKKRTSMPRMSMKIQLGNKLNHTSKMYNDIFLEKYSQKELISPQRIKDDLSCIS